MPFGPAPLGFAYFAGVKFVGYSAYAGLLNSRVSQPFCKVPNAWKSGLVRAGIGVAIGTVVGLAFWKLVPRGWLNNYGDVLFYSGLIPVRILEWYFFLWLLYRQCHLRTSQRALAITCGIIVSFLLDAVGVLTMLIVPGGAWVC